MPNQVPAHEEEVILAETIARPTLGARRLGEHLAERGVHRSASGVQKVLRRHDLGTRRLRVAALAALTAADHGLVAPRALEPFGFCLWAARPGDLVGLDCFYVGKLKGIGPIWQLSPTSAAERGVSGVRFPSSRRSDAKSAWVPDVRKWLGKHMEPVAQTGRYSNLPGGRFHLLTVLSEPRFGQAVSTLLELAKRRRPRR